MRTRILILFLLLCSLSYSQVVVPMWRYPQKVELNFRVQAGRVITYSGLALAGVSIFVGIDEITTTNIYTRGKKPPRFETSEKMRIVGLSMFFVGTVLSLEYNSKKTTINFKPNEIRLAYRF